jgi:hypothetical protein
MRRCLAFFVFLVAAGVAAPAGAQSIAPADEARVLQMVNVTRAQLGLTPLASNQALVDVARAQSQRMAAKGDIYHNPNLSEELTDLGLPWVRAGENVGVGPSVDSIEQAFVASPHHYENIVRSGYRFLGVGVIVEGGRVWVTQVFAELEDARAAVAAPRPPAPAAAPAPRPSAAAPAPPVNPPATPLPPPPVASEGGIVSAGSVFAAADEPAPSLFALVKGLFRYVGGL